MTSRSSSACGCVAVFCPYLAASDADSLAWRAHAIASHVEVDMPPFGVNIAAPRCCVSGACWPTSTR